ncbi:MAG: T9SS type A sorting domain-containing protein [Bacteroidales bacterium]|nr:T9SS type A sorting domain-containing protein [Bacteroidales bacterium]
MERNIIKVLLLLLLALAGTVKAQRWEVLHTGVTEDLYDICCIDANTIFVCGQNGVILKTEDGGATWQEKHRNPGWAIVSMKFADENTGYGLVLKNGYEIFLLKTVDSGESWSSFNILNQMSGCRNDDPLELFMVGKPIELFVLNADTVFIRNYHEIIKSADGGLTFDGYVLGFSEDFGGNGADEGIRGEYFENNLGLVIGYDNENHNTLRVMKTEDCGNHWENIANHVFSFLYIGTVYFGEDGYAKIIGGIKDGSGASYNVIETTDGFEHVTMYHTSGEDVGYWTQYSDVDFCSNRRGCYTTSINWDKEFYSESHIFINDNGPSWTEIPLAYPFEKLFIYSVAAIDNFFLIASQKGFLYYIGGGPNLETEEDETKLSVFPNPVENKLEIKTENAQKVEVFDNTGRTVIEMPVCQDYITIDCSKLIHGVYVVVLTDNKGKRHVKKVVKSN